MVYTRENNNNGPGGNSLSYPQLDRYNTTPHPLGNNGNVGYPFIGNNHSEEKGYVVPEFNAISYDALTHGVAPTSGYHNIRTAYHANESTCNPTYRFRMINQ